MNHIAYLSHEELVTFLFCAAIYKYHMDLDYQGLLDAAVFRSHQIAT